MQTRGFFDRHPTLGWAAIIGGTVVTTLGMMGVSIVIASDSDAEPIPPTIGRYIAPETPRVAIRQQSPMPFLSLETETGTPASVLRMVADSIDDAYEEVGTPNFARDRYHLTVTITSKSKE